MAREDGEVGRRGVPRRWRIAIRWLAPRSEQADILGDLEDEGAEIAQREGPRAAVRLVRWHVLRSLVPWTDRRLRAALRRGGRIVSMGPIGLTTDVRLAVRRLGQAPGFTMLAVATLAIGLGAVATVFSLAWALWLQPLPYAEPDRLAYLHAVHRPTGSRASLTSDELRDFQRRPGSFASLAGFRYGAAITRVGNEPVRMVTHHVSPNLFRVLGVRPALGRDFGDDDAGSPIAIISHGLWSSRFDRDPAILDRTLVLDGEPHAIAGVMPPGFWFPQILSADAWIAAELDDDQRYIQAIGRLADGETVGTAATQADALARGRAAALGGEARDWSATASAADVTASASSRLAYQTLLGLVGLFLLVGCANLAGLLMARNQTRRGELAVCLSLGASRGRLARALVVESLLLAGGGCAAGLALAASGTRAVATLMPSTLPRLGEVGLNVPVTAVAVGAAVVAAVVVGLVSAGSLRSLRSSEALTGARTAAGVSRGQRALVVVEVGLAVVLLVGASAMLRSFSDAIGRDRGYDPRGLQALNVSLPFSDDSYDTARRARAFDDMLARVEAVPGVNRAAATTGFPGSRLGILGAAPVTPTDHGAQVIAALHAASPGYFETMGTPVRGRPFAAADVSGAPGVAIVNEQLAGLFPDGNPIGQSLSLSVFGSQPAAFEIVGVAGDIHLSGNPGHRVFVPLAQVSPYWIDLVFRADAGAAAMPAVRRALRDMSPDLLIENASSFQTIISNSLALERAQSGFAGLIGALSTIVAGVGLYALMTFVISQRRRELGIRLALGSPPGRLFRLALSSALRLVAAGVALGLTASTLLVRALGSQVFGLAAADARSYLVGTALVLGVGVLAAWWPARRVMRLDPLIALRAD